MTVLNKTWYFTISLEGGRIVRHQWRDWQTAKREAGVRGGQAEMEAIECEEERDAETGQRISLRTTGNRRYVYADSKGQEATPYVCKSGDDYYARRKQVEADLLNKEANRQLVGGAARPPGAGT